MARAKASLQTRILAGICLVVVAAVTGGFMVLAVMHVAQMLQGRPCNPAADTELCEITLIVGSPLAAVLGLFLGAAAAGALTNWLAERSKSKVDTSR
jgi:hypothetical protein